MLDEEPGEPGHRDRMGVEVKGQRQVADIVDGEKGPVADHEGLHVLFEGHPAVELVGALREIVELLELGPAPGFVHVPSPCPLPRGERELHVLSRSPEGRGNFMCCPAPRRGEGIVA